MFLSRVGLAAAALSLTACAGATQGTEAGSDFDRSSVSRVVIRVDGETAPVNLVTLIQSRVTNLQVRRNGSSCPELEFRGRNSLMMPTPPSVYINGQRAVNTCVLDLMDPKDISLVEVYPMGVTNRPGYYSTAGGLILVFLKDGGQVADAGG